MTNDSTETCIAGFVH